MRFIKQPGIELLYQETKVVLHIDNRYRTDILRQLEKIKDIDNDYTLEIKKRRTEEKGTAEGYIWGIITKIAEVKKQRTVTVYRDYIKKIIPPHKVYFETMGEAERSKEEWENQGLGWQVLSITDYKEYVKCERVRGYSGWNFNEVERFIRALEKECKLLNIKLE